MATDLQNKKVLFLASWYPSRINEFLGNFVQKHAEMVNEITKVNVLYAISDANVTSIEIDEQNNQGVKTVIVYYPKVKNRIPILKTFLKRKSYFEALQKGYEKLNCDFDLIHLNISFPAGLFAVKLSETTKTPFIITEQWTGFLEHTGRYNQLPFHIKREFRRIFKNAKMTLPVSEHLGERLKQLNLVKDYHAIPNIVNQNYFYPSKEDRPNDIPIRFIHVSTFDDNHKNISGMLRVIQQLQYSYSLHIITEGETDEVYKKLKQFKIPLTNCLVSEKLNSKEVGEAMRQADCLINFSNYETFSVVLAEAWSTGIPVIYSKCGGLTEINNPTLGIQLKIGDEEGLLKSLQGFSPSDYSKEKITAFAKQFSEEAFIEKCKEIYRRII